LKKKGRINWTFWGTSNFFRSAQSVYCNQFFYLCM